MKCPNEGQIQAYIDRELREKETKEMEVHFFQCEKCMQTYKELKEANSFVFQKMQNYNKDFNMSNVSIENLKINEVKSKKGVFINMKKYKKIAAAACAAIIVTTCVTVKPIRAAVVDAVSIFRAKDIKSVKFSVDDIQKLEKGLENHLSDIDLDKIGKVKFEGGQQKTVTMEEAKKRLPFKVYVPQNMQEKNADNITLDEPSKIDFTLNVENVNQILNSLGGKNIFPKELDGKTFSLNMPGMLNVSYKDAANSKHFYITESKVPEINAPAEANVDEIFNALTELSVLPPEMQKQLKSMKDWKSTLYIPNVENNLEEMTIDGMKAIGNFEKDNSSILVLKDGVLISVSGNVSKNEIIEIVKSMR